jgi:hypothetical protein
LDEEFAFLQRICDNDSVELIIQQVENRLIQDHKDIMYSEFYSMIIGMFYQGVCIDLTQDCTRMYELVSRIPMGIEPMLQVFESYSARLGENKLIEFAKTEKVRRKYNVCRIHGNTYKSCMYCIRN